MHHINAELGFGELTTNRQIWNNRLQCNIKVGLEIYGCNHVIRGNKIWGTVQRNSRDADGIQFFWSGHVIRENYIHEIMFSDPEYVSPDINYFKICGDSNRESGHDILFEQNWCDNFQA